MSDPRDYKLDISSLPNSDAAKPALTGRPYLSVLFECCGVYQRIYKSADGAAYRGLHHPKCGLPVNFAVGEAGDLSAVLPEFDSATLAGLPFTNSR